MHKLKPDDFIFYYTPDNYQFIKDDCVVDFEYDNTHGDEITTPIYGEYHVKAKTVKSPLLKSMFDNSQKL